MGIQIQRWVWSKNWYSKATKYGITPMNPFER